MANEYANTMNVFRYSISLRIKHPSVDPDRITSVLKLEPEYVNRVGERKMTPKGDVLEGFYEETFWRHRFSITQSNDIEETLTEILGFLLPESAFFQEIYSTGGVADLYVGVFMVSDFGFEFDVDLIQSISSLNIKLGMNYYIENREKGTAIAEQ